MFSVSGKTWDHKERLRELGGVWNADAKNWSFYSTPSPSEMSEIKNMAGCLVTEGAKPQARPEPAETDDGDMLSFLSLATDPKGRDGRFNTAFYGDDKEYFNYFKDKNPAAFFGFSSLGKFARFIEEIPEYISENERRNSGWRYDSYGSFHGTKDMSEALELCRKGWIEGIDKASKLAHLISVEHAQQKKRSYSVAGGSVSVGRMLAGNPAHMVKRAKKPGSRNITLFVQNNGNALISAETLIIRCALCCAIIDILETNGYSCELIAVTTDYFGNRKPSEHLTVKLKQAGEKTNIADVAFAIGHPSYFRRFGFAAIGYAEECREAWSDMGNSTSAFNKHHMPSGRNEFYISHPTTNYKGATLEEKARNMLPDFLPVGLPIHIGE